MTLSEQRKELGQGKEGVERKSRFVKTGNKRISESDW